MADQLDNNNDTFRPTGAMDAELQREVDEALGDMSLGDLIDQGGEAGPAGAGADQADSEVRYGKVIAVQGDDIFVELGGKDQGLLPAAQFVDEPLPEVGSPVEVVVTGYDQTDGLVLLSRKGAVIEADWDTLEMGQTVEGRVTALNTGGLELNVNGIRAFMPVSHIELHRVEDLRPYINKKLSAKVIEIKRRSENLIISRRELLNEEMAKLREEAMGKLAEGQTVAGVVKTIMPYGAFVDIGGVDGLLHVSDMSYSRVDDPSSIVSEGQQVEVMILKIDPETQKISLGLKQTLRDPWEDVEITYQISEIVSGRVTRMAKFGAFVELAPGVEGLVPLSELSFDRRIRQAEQVVKVGDAISVKVLNVDAARRRIGLSLKQVGDDPWMGASNRWPEDSTVEGLVTRILDFGAFVELTAGVEGMIHISELSSNRVRAVGDVLTEGQTISAKVLEVDEERRRISLSLKAMEAEQGHFAVAEAAGSQGDSDQASAAPRKRTKPLKGGLDHPGGGLSLGDLLSDSDK